MPRDLTRANEARFEGSVHYSVLKSEIEAFRDRWHIRAKDLPEILDVPMGTIDSIINDNKSEWVMRDNAHKVRSGIRNYNPRTCTYRRIPKGEAAKVLRQIRDRHKLTWKEVEQAVQYPEPKIRQIVSAGSDQRYVHINVVRDMLISYNQWVANKVRDLA